MSGYLLLKSSVILLISTGYLSHCVLSLLTSQVIILPAEKYMFACTTLVNVPAAVAGFCLSASVFVWDYACLLLPCYACSSSLHAESKDFNFLTSDFRVFLTSFLIFCTISPLRMLKLIILWSLLLSGSALLTL